MNNHDRRIEIIIGMEEQRKRTETATEAWCKVCNRPVTKLPHEHDVKVRINPNKGRGI